MIGKTIGTYQVLAKLGEGGMGEVYRARDTTLNRDVAIKILPPGVATDPDRLARFRREAELLASLNHPHIAHIYGVETSAAGPALVMEFLDGKALDEIVGGRPMVWDDALAIARQIADALECAHERGIIHRDLKPANIKITERGVVKVLDFGLAKAISADAGTASSEVANSPTITARAPQLGVILGTAAYMSPEQAKGRPVDRRADIWAFGAVLFEMLTGRRAFSGDDVTDVMASVIKSEPLWGALPHDTPQAVRRLLRSCLEKDPKRRLRDIADGMLQLDEGLSEAPAGSEANVTTSSRLIRAAPFAMAGLGLAALAVAAALVTSRHDGRDPIRIVSVGDDVALTANPRPVIAISADGREIYYRGRIENASGALFVKKLHEFEGRHIPGTENATTPFLSPDGRWLGFVLGDGRDLQLFKVPIEGGPRTSIVDSPVGVVGADWGQDGTVVFGTSLGLFKVASGSDAPVAFTTAADQTGSGGHVWPSFATPDLVLFVIGRDERARLAATRLSTSKVEDLNIRGTAPKFLPTGHIAYATHDNAIRVVPFDAARVVITGDPVPLETGVRVSTVSAAADFDVSETGALVFVSADIDAARTLVWLDPQQRKETPIAAPPGPYAYPRLSQDDHRLAVGGRDRQELWTLEFARPVMKSVARATGTYMEVAWSADGGAIYFPMSQDGRFGLYRQNADGSGQRARIAESTVALIPYVALRDNSALIVRHGADLALLKLDGSGQILPLVRDARNAALAPDDRWLAYDSTGPGRRGVYVRPFPDVNNGVWEVSNTGASAYSPLWSRATKELFFRSDPNLMSVATDTAPAFSSPRVVLSLRDYAPPGLGRAFDVARDGRFLMVKPAPRADPVIKIVLNWFTDVVARVRPR